MDPACRLLRNGLRPGVTVWFIICRGLQRVELPLAGNRMNFANIEDVLQQLGICLLGAVPSAPESILNQPACSGDRNELRQHNLLGDTIDSLRTRLVNKADAAGARLLMVASAVAGEGKTTLASHLAVSLTRAGRRTLLVDADLAHPTAHTRFGLTVEPGFCDLLRAQAHVADVIRPTSAPGLWLLPAGRADAAAIRAMDRDGLASIIRRLKAEYDMILIDTSPLLPLPYSLLVGKWTDTVILAIRRAVSQVMPVTAGYHRLTTLGVPVLGAVLLDAQGPP